MLPDVSDVRSAELFGHTLTDTTTMDNAKATTAAATSTLATPFWPGEVRVINQWVVLLALWYVVS